MPPVASLGAALWGTEFQLPLLTGKTRRLTYPEESLHLLARHHSGGGQSEFSTVLQAELSVPGRENAVGKW
jgi:hypothetical protein